MIPLLRFTDRPRYELRRLTLALAGLCLDLAGESAGTKENFDRFSKAANKTRMLLKGTGSGRARLLSRLETAAACLGTVRLDLELHHMKPDPAAVEALLFTERALRLQADFLAGSAGKAALSDAAKNAASASRGLSLALRAARSEPAEFIPNLKFSRIYSGLENTASAVADYADLLAETL